METNGFRIVETPQIMFLVENEYWESLCRRCGECCWLCNPQKDKIKRCPFLEKQDEKTFRCAIYTNPLREGGFIETIEGQKNYCSPIELVFHRSPDCPYNYFLQQIRVE